MSIEPIDPTLASRVRGATPCACPRAEHTFFGVPIASAVWHALLDIPAVIEPTEGRS